MRVFLYHIFIPNERISELIRNSSNNENWPRANKYIEILKTWNKEIEKQQAIVKKYGEYLKSKRKGDNNFLISVKNAISAKIRVLTSADPNFTDLPDELKAKELESLRFGYKIFERDKYFSGNWANTELIDKDNLLETYDKLKEWNEQRPYPIQEVSDLLDASADDRKKIDSEFPQIEQLRSFEVQMLERTKDTITFIWTLPKNVKSEISPESNYQVGKPAEIKEKILDIETTIGSVRVFPNINNYLFLFNGQYYEVQDWQQTNYDTAEIVAEISIFYNYYWYVIKSSANGILHHSPLARSEICSCPEYDRATNYYDYASDYRLKLWIYKTTISGAGQNIIYGSGEREGTLPMIHGIGIERVPDVKNEVRNVLTSKMWNDAWNALSGISVGGFSLGQGQNELGVLYYLLNDKLGTDNDFHNATNYKWKEPIGTNGMPNMNKGIEQILYKWGLTNERGEPVPFMRHFLQWHVKATLYWRKKEVWEGRYWLLHDKGYQVDEICNAAGNTITIFASNVVLARMTENITAKLGLSSGGTGLLNVAVDVSLHDDKGQNLRQAERTVVSDSKKSGGETTHTESKTITKSPVSMGKGNKPRIGIPSPQPLLFGSDHTKSEYTFLQFESRWLLSGYYPLSLRIQFNRDLLNQYRNRKELKGFPAYDYFNALQFGDILNKVGFLQASIISWNNVPYSNWFREKIEAGVYIFREDHEEFYKKPISSPLSFASKGGTTRGSFDTTTLRNNLTTTHGKDNYVSVDGLSWVWKDSFFRIKGQSGSGYFPSLMSQNDMAKNLIKQDNRAWKFEGTGIGTATQSIKDNNWYEWWLHSFDEHEGIKGLEFRCADEKGLKVIVSQNGAEWSLKIEGNVEYRKRHGDPEKVPPAGDPSIDPIDPIGGSPEPFDPMTNNPIENIGDPDPLTGGLGGDPELVPDFETEPDQEPPEPETEPEPEPEPEPEGEPEPEPEPDPEPEYS